MHGNTSLSNCLVYAMIRIMQAKCFSSAETTAQLLNQLCDLTNT